MIRRRDAYVARAEATETQLSNLTHDTDVLGMVYTPAFSEVRQLIPTSTRPIPLIDSETGRQIANLERLRDDLIKTHRPGHDRAGSHHGR
jgi:hypothetical protein